jgi:hypothetical protein
MFKRIGYWTDDTFEFDRLITIHPKYLVDHNWEVARRSKIVCYLKSGVCALEELGCSYCRFEDGPPDREMGCVELSDGVYIWPEGLAIYIERYHIRLPDEFIRHMAENNFTIPKDLDAKAIKRRCQDEPSDFESWKTWCKIEMERIAQ